MVWLFNFFFMGSIKNAKKKKKLGIFIISKMAIPIVILQLNYGMQLDGTKGG